MAITIDGSLHSTAVGERVGNETWVTEPPPAALPSAGRGAHEGWQFVTRAMQPQAFLVAGARSFGLYDWRAKRVESLSALPGTDQAAFADPWASPTSSLCCHPDANFQHLFGRATAVRSLETYSFCPFDSLRHSALVPGWLMQTCVELFDHRYLSQPTHRWRHYQEGYGVHDLLQFAVRRSREHRQPYRACDALGAP